MSLRWIRLLHLQEPQLMVPGWRSGMSAFTESLGGGLTADRTIKSVVTSPTA
jgi:hypothetical protein